MTTDTVQITDVDRIINCVLPDTLAPYAERLRTAAVTPENAWNVCVELTEALILFRAEHSELSLAIDLLGMESVLLLREVSRHGGTHELVAGCLERCESIVRETV